jgi:hypothetical protein
MAIKETPINYRTYYKLMKEKACNKIEELKQTKDELSDNLKVQHKNLLDNVGIYKSNFDVDLLSYIEFKENRYINGKFYKVADGLFLNRKNDYEIVSDLYTLYQYAKNQKKLNDLEKEIDKQSKLAKLTLKQYTEILRIFYTEVHKKLILEGKGYVFSGNIGWICINRIVLRRNKPIVDYAATKKREAELKKQGKRIYNKEEADWCKKNGIEYKAEDKRVFRKDEYIYEIPLVFSRLTNGSKLKLEITDYRHRDIRGKSNDELIELCNSDINKICELPIDLKTKVTLCDKADKILYTKFIRNENQTALIPAKIDSKNR